MTTWRKIVQSLTRSHGGFLADGRALGLGLASAMEAQRREPSADVEAYLRRHAESRRHTSVS